MESQRVPDGFRHLPRVPRTGRATEVLPQILLNTRPETLRKANSKRKPGSGPIGSKGHAKRSSRVGTQTRGRSSSVVGKALNFGRFLVQEDRLAKLQFSESVLAPGGDSGQHDVGLALKALEEKSLESSEKDVLASLASFWEDSSMLDPLDPLTSVSNRERDGSAPMELSSCDGLCGRSWAAQQAYCRSLMSSRNDSRTGAAQVSRDETTPELHPELRRQDLQRSFSIFPEEVVARLKDFRRRPVGDYHIDAPDAKADDSGSDGPMSSNSNVSFLEDLIPVAPKRRSSKISRISEDSDSTATGAPQRKVLRAVPESLEELRELIQGAQLTMIPLKVPPQPELMTLNADIELIEPDISSPREELLRGIKVLNIFRWFCRLPPVQLEEDEAEVCDFLSNALMLRQPVFLSESHLISRRIFELGHQLGGFLAKGDSTVMLHKESSLVSAISVGILCSHTVGWSYASTPAPEQRHAVRSPAHQRLKEETMQRAARHRDRQLLEAPKEGVSKGGFAMLLSLAQAKEPVTLQNLPEPLAGYRTLWEISDRWTADKEPKVEKRPEAPPRPRTNGSSRSRPGTVGTMGTAASNGSKEDRPNTSSSRVRQVVWGSTESAKRREWGRACNLSWGDRSRSLILRRQLLNSKLRSIGGSRVNDTCVLRAPPSADASKEDEPDFVVFPPEGVCPMELLVGCHLPTWTIMPDSQQFQPSHSLQVRMWRVRLLRREDAAEETAVEATERRRSRGSSCTLPEEPPYDAIRLEELPLSFFTCDCAAEGNSFCIIFRPQLSRISEGDQLEVELLGLRGSSQRHHFFHEFRSCGELAWQDHEFFEEVQNFCKMFSDIDVFKGSFPLPTVSRSFSLPSDTALPELKPISHLSKDFKTDEVELSMYFYCAGVAAFEADLYLQRSDGKIRVDRSTLVFNLDDHFLVRVKLPCSVSKYELAFRLSTMQRPRKLLEHPLKYSIRSLESRSFPLNGVEDPPSQKYQRYGFCPVPPTAQLLGMTILAPMEYGLLPGSLYFLVHIQPACLPMEVPPEPVGETRPSQLFERLRCDHDEAEERALEMQLIKQKDPLFSAETGDHSTRMDEMLRRRSFQNTQRMMLHRPSVAAMDPTVNVMRRLHHGLELHLAERTQDLPQMMHLDLVVRESRSNQQRFALRLQRKLDHPEFYEGVLHLADHDPGAKVELYYRITEETYRAPLKVAEWRVGRLNEAYDD